MHPFYAVYFEKISLLHGQIAAALQDLPQAALDWQPAEGTNSLAVLAVHIAGSYLYWFTDVISQQTSGRDRAAEFLTRDLGAEAINARLDESLALTRQVLEPLRLEDLAAERYSTRDQRSYSVGYALLHILEHTALHLAHMQVTRQWWQAQTKPEGFS
jgi:uncharacterized damage-inducible protein DinB